jgi:cyclopropane fatty-acyl-phospholipid synthase-like methyltransferase
MATPITWTRELVARFWEGVSASRLSELSFSRHNAGHLVDLARPDLKPGGRHLDFGAGEGDLVKVLIERGFAAAAFEPVGSRLTHLPASVTAHPNFLGVVDEKSDARFEAVWLADVIEHILDEDLSAVLRRIRTLLAPDGVVIVTTPFSEDLDHGAAYCPSCRTLFHRWQHVRSFTGDSLTALFASHGFQRVRAEAVDFSCNRFVTEDLRKLHDAYEAVRTREARSWMARARRLFGLPDRLQPVRLTADPAGTPTHILYIGRAARP